MSFDPPQTGVVLPAEFRGVQALRGLAALMVVAFHATQVWSRGVASDPDLLSWQNGFAGVDIFFVISGFVMTVSSIGKKGGAHPARNFMERRLVRIVPLYWLVTACVLLKLWLVRLHPELQNSGEHVAISLPYVVSSFLFVPYQNSLGLVQPLLSVGWTLSFEMFFYLLFAAALALRVSEVRLLTPVLLALSVLSLFRTERWPAIGALASPLLLDFLAGILIGRLIQARMRLSSLACALGGGVALIAMMTLRHGGFLGGSWAVWGVPAMVVVMCAVLLEEKLARHIPRWVQAIGDASYSLYLSHLLVFALVLKLLKRSHLLDPGATNPRGEMATLSIFLVASTLASVLLYRWVEAPVNNALRKRLRLREAKLQPVAP